MLRSLTIEQFAIIERLELTFADGLTVLTGETGAGKSILLGALNLALGERSDPTMVRMGAERARITAVFEVSEAGRLHGQLDALEAAPEDGTLYLSRELLANGRSQARINGRPVPVSVLKQAGDLLVDLHGQHEHQSLFRPEEQLNLIDERGGTAAAHLLQQINDAWMRRETAIHTYQELKASSEERERLRDLYQYQVQEIDAARLVPGEEELLDQEYRRLMHAERLHELTGLAYERLSAGEYACLDTLAQAQRALEEAAGFDAQLQPCVDALEAAAIALQETARDARSYRDGIDFTPERLPEVTSRLDLIKSLSRKYGAGIPAILENRDRIAALLSQNDQNDQQMETLQGDIGLLDRELAQAADALSTIRRETAQALAQQITDALRGLALDRAQVVIEVTPAPLSRSGADAVQFLFSANPTEPVRPLNRVASGGELSRVMLAIKTAAARASAVPTLVFDEVDAGIGGETAHAVANRLRQLADNRQVICITHLPQLAAPADSHVAIEKVDEPDGRTVTRVRQLDRDGRVAELARMLGGGPAALAHAASLLDGSQSAG